MSHSLYFYKVSKVTEKLPAIINTDSMDFQYYDISIENAAAWEKEIGILRTIEYSTVDFFDVGEKLFGKTPTSISSRPEYYLQPNSPWAEVEMIFPDGERRRVHRSEIDKFRYDKRYQAYIYQRDLVSEIENGYSVESEKYEDRPLLREDLLEMAKQCVDDHENDCYAFTGAAVPLYEIMKAYFAICDGTYIICHSE